MNQQAQRIAIALHCGAKWMLFSSGYTFLTFSKGLDGFTEVTEPADPEKVTISVSVPDYLGDLNAMHEAEKGLTMTQASAFTAHLETIMDNSADCPWPAGDHDWHATAAQRAEAFLKTLFLWTND